MTDSSDDNADGEAEPRDDWSETPMSEPDCTFAIEELIRRRQPWLLERVRRRLGGKLRVRVDSGDILQEALLRFLAYRSKLPQMSEEDFCRLMSRIVENSIRDQWAFFSAKRRNFGRELSSEASEEELKQLSDDASSPSGVMQFGEKRSLATFALGLLSPIDRRIVHLRIQNMPYRNIATELGITEEAAMSRYRRARSKLIELIRDLESGAAGSIDWAAIDAYCEGRSTDSATRDDETPGASAQDIV